MQRRLLLLFTATITVFICSGQSPKPTCRYMVKVPKAYFYDQIKTSPSRKLDNLTARANPKLDSLSHSPATMNPDTLSNLPRQNFTYIKRRVYLVYGDYIYIYCKATDNNWIYITFENKKGIITRGYVSRLDFNDGDAD